MGRIALTKGYFAQVDDFDHEWLNEFSWHVFEHGNINYAMTSIMWNGKPKHYYMHRMIMETPVEMQVDHIDFNGLNCLRENMRNCTPGQNQMNKRVRRNASSKYNGVSRHAMTLKYLLKSTGEIKKYPYIIYRASIRLNYKYIHIGNFKTEIEAAIAYNNKALELFGEFANLNKI